MRPRLSIRVNPDNPRHHLWLNRGKWWIHYMLVHPGGLRRRVRFSLETSDLEEAQRLRDEYFEALGGANGVLGESGA